MPLCVLQVADLVEERRKHCEEATAAINECKLRIVSVRI